MIRILFCSFGDDSINQTKFLLPAEGEVVERRSYAVSIILILRALQAGAVRSLLGAVRSKCDTLLAAGFADDDLYPVNRYVFDGRVMNAVAGQAAHVHEDWFSSMRALWEYCNKLLWKHA